MGRGRAGGGDVSTQTCRCGCGSQAVFIVRGNDYDPRTPGRKGARFVEYACAAAARYMQEASAELGWPCHVERLP